MLNYLNTFEEFVMLAVLRRRIDVYGIVIRDMLESAIGKEVSIGAIYTTLDRLEEKGLVGHYQSDPEPVRGGRSRKMFFIKDAGVTALLRTQSIRDAIR